MKFVRVYLIEINVILGNNFPIAPQKDLLIATVDVKEEYTLNFEIKQRLVFEILILEKPLSGFGNQVILRRMSQYHGEILTRRLRAEVLSIFVRSQWCSVIRLPTI